MGFLDSRRWPPSFFTCKAFLSTIFLPSFLSFIFVALLPKAASKLWQFLYSCLFFLSIFLIKREVFSWNITYFNFSFKTMFNIMYNYSFFPFLVILKQFYSLCCIQKNCISAYWRESFSNGGPRELFVFKSSF